MAGCSPAPVAESTPREPDLRALVREADLGLERVYVDSNLFYYELLSDLETPEFEWRGALLWRYDGQQVYTDQPDPPPTIREFIEPDYVLTGLDWDPDAYFGVGKAHRSDKYGRRWVLDYVDVEAARAIAAADEADAALWNGPEPGVEVNPGIAYNPDAGVRHYVLPTSWDTVSCGGADEYFDHQGNGDMIQTPTTPLNERQRKIVFIDGVEDCSGTMVDSDTVLTAAHCITTDSGFDHVASSFTVCSMENLDENIDGSHIPDCFGVVDVQQGPGWIDDEPFEVEEDYGLLHLDGVPGNGWFELSSASDGAITGPTDFLRGYPGKRRNCNSNRVTNDALTTVDTEDGRWMYQANGAVQSTPTGWIKWDTSVALGVSGGPHFYCPNAGGCANGHYQTGVQSVVNLSCPWDGDSYTNPPCASGYVGGPKARDIETWVDNNK